MKLYVHLGVVAFSFLLGCSDSDETTSGSGGSGGSGTTTITSSTGGSGGSSSMGTTGGSGGTGGTTGSGGAGATGGGGATGGTGGAGGGMLGPVVLELDTDPNAVFWDAAENTLYLTDDTANQLLKWTDAAGFSVVADLPTAPPEGAGLGQLVRLPDGTFVIPRFGFGISGGVIVVHPDGTSDLVPNLDPVRRRIGLTRAADGTLYVSGFVKMGAGKAGFVSELDLAGVEVDVGIAGLLKPVGVLAVGELLYVSDQDKKQIFSAPLANPSQSTLFSGAAGVPLDLLSAGPNGSLFTGGTLGQVYRVSSTGMLEVFYGGLEQVRGTTFDPAGSRLFAVDHDGNAADGIKNHLVVLPVAP